MTPNDDTCVAYQFKTAKCLIAKIGDSHVLRFNQDRLESNYEVKLINDFFRDVQDCADRWDELDPDEQTLVQLSLDQSIVTLGNNGFLVYGCQRQENYVVDDSVIQDWQVTYIMVLRNRNSIAPNQGEAHEAAASDLPNFIVIQPRQ